MRERESTACLLYKLLMTAKPNREHGERANEQGGGGAHARESRVNEQARRRERSRRAPRVHKSTLDESPIESQYSRASASAS